MDVYTCKNIEGPQAQHISFDKMDVCIGTEKPLKEIREKLPYICYINTCIVWLSANDNVERGSLKKKDGNNSNSIALNQLEW